MKATRWLAGALVGAMGWMSTAAAAVEPGDVRWTTERVETVRFVGEPTPGPAFEAESRVTVVAVQDEVVRVALGNRFGWVPATSLTDVEPERETPALPPGLPANLADKLLTPPPKLGDGIK